MVKSGHQTVVDQIAQSQLDIFRSNCEALGPDIGVVTLEGEAIYSHDPAGISSEIFQLFAHTAAAKSVLTRVRGELARFAAENEGFANKRDETGIKPFITRHAMEAFIQKIQTTMDSAGRKRDYGVQHISLVRFILDHTQPTELIDNELD